MAIPSMLTSPRKKTRLALSLNFITPIIEGQNYFTGKGKG
jgi:hypothetical protein